jgi:4-oxalomesaconate hydratase
MTTASKRIMVFAAHPQDPFERTGGTVARHIARGDEVMFVTLTTGVVTHAFNVFPPTGEDKLKDIDQVKATKRNEFELGCKTLGVAQWAFLDFNESPLLVGMEEYLVMINLIREFRPDVVMCPHPTEVGRQDHMDCGRYVIAAVDYARADGVPSPLAPHAVKDIFMFYYPDFRSDQLLGATRKAPEVVVDITDVLAQKRAAMEAFASTQAKKNEDYNKKMDKFFASVDGAAGFMNGMGYAEQFVRWWPERVQYLPLSS